MRTALLAASMTLVAVSTVGCSSGPPTDASADDFCGTFEKFVDEANSLGEEPDPKDVITALKKVGEELEEVGTPEGIPEDARAGFELTVETIKGLDEDSTLEEIQTLDEDFTDAEQKQSDAFDAYLTETCDDAPSEEPTE